MVSPTRLVRLSIVLAALVAWGVPSSVARAADDAEATAATATAARERAVGRATERGLSWLAGRYENGLPPESEAPVAVVSLSGLAFLESGATPDQGRYGRV